MTKTTRIDKMLPRSLQLNREWFAKVQETLALRQLTQNAIAKKLQVSPLSVSKFINGKPIALNTFIRLSDEFNLDWQEISQAERDWNDTIENFKFKQSQFKANPGGDIAPEEVIGRDQLIITLWERLRQQSLIYLGERRIGKSSV
jgi:transcriptional regulator with XRE-family HTH domain